MTAWVALSPANLEERVHEVLTRFTDAGSPSSTSTRSIKTISSLAGRRSPSRWTEKKNGRLHPKTRRDVASSRQAGAWFGTQSVQRPPYRVGDPLHPDRCQATEGTGLATLVRGVDRDGNFDHEPRPKRDLDEAALAAHEGRDQPSGQGTLFRHGQTGVSRLTRAKPWSDCGCPLIANSSLTGNTRNGQQTGCNRWWLGERRSEYLSKSAARTLDVRLENRERRMTPEQVLSIKPKFLTQKQREFYFENGYLLLEKLLPRRLDRALAGRHREWSTGAERDGLGRGLGY